MFTFTNLPPPTETSSRSFLNILFPIANYSNFPSRSPSPSPSLSLSLSLSLLDKADDVLLCTRMLISRHNLFVLIQYYANRTFLAASPPPAQVRTIKEGYESREYIHTD